MKKLLITGFEPFGGESINPSWEAVSLLPDEINGYALTKLRIPVVFGEASARVITAAENLQPDAILCIGQAGGRTAVTPELVGINLRHSKIPDNAGNQPKDEPIAAGGETAYFSTLPVRKMAEAIHARGIPAQVSYSAGAYVCNDVLYSLLARYKDTETGVAFIHIPYSAEQNKEPSMELTRIAEALTVAIEAI
jgi:pyroglutamyl-peptidase